MTLLFLALTVLSLLTFYMLWQVDGNYYILWDSVLVLTAFLGLPEEGSEKSGAMALSLYVCALLTTLITSWSGAVGFTPIRLVNYGFYDNISEIRDFEIGRGAAELWAEMSADPANRVLAFAETPDCYKILCNVQSITDVEAAAAAPVSMTVSLISSGSSAGRRRTISIWREIS